MATPSAGASSWPPTPPPTSYPEYGYNIYGGNHESGASSWPPTPPPTSYLEYGYNIYGGNHESGASSWPPNPPPTSYPEYGYNIYGGNSYYEADFAIENGYCCKWDPECLHSCTSSCVGMYGDMMCGDKSQPTPPPPTTRNTEIEIPRERASIARRKVFARQETFCA